MKLSKEERANWSKEQKKFYKQHGYPLPDKDVELISELDPRSSNDGLTVLCVRFGKRYGVEYVEKLRNMVSRHITVPYEFVCLTDDPTKLDGVNILYRPNAGYVKGWWHKVHMFDPTLNLSGRVLYFDLDVIIHNNIEKLIKVGHGDFFGIQDFNRKFHANWIFLNSSVMTWRAGTQNDIWEKFKADIPTAMRLHGDQDWIWRIAKDRIKFWPKEWIQSYKWEIRSREELTNQGGVRKFRESKSSIKIHPHCCVTVFHGDPKPPDVQDQFVVDNWR
jgi:hypothetical protein